MKTKSVRAIIEDANKIEQASRELSAELQRRVTVSEVLHEIMECLTHAKERIKTKNVEPSKKTKDIL